MQPSTFAYRAAIFREPSVSFYVHLCQSLIMNCVFRTMCINMHFLLPDVSELMMLQCHGNKAYHVINAS